MCVCVFFSLHVSGCVDLLSALEYLQLYLGKRSLMNEQELQNQAQTCWGGGFNQNIMMHITRFSLKTHISRAG